MPIDIIERARKVRIIFVPFAGIDALPLEVIKERGIRIANAHGNAPFVAERAIAVALAFYGKIIDYHNDLTMGKWHGFRVRKGVGDSWDSLQGKTCAILGTGEIGGHIARLLKAFSCATIGFRRRRTKPMPEFFDETTITLNEALELSLIHI